MRLLSAVLAADRLFAGFGAQAFRVPGYGIQARNTMVHLLRKFVAAAFVLCVVSGFASTAMAEDKSGTLYTAYNLWYEKPLRMPSANYHVGTLIPVGSKVSDVRISSKRLEFVYNGGQFAIEFVQKYHPTLNIVMFKDQVFTTADPAVKIDALTKQDQEWIKAGVVQPGMTKEAVLHCWGPAPQHVTPSTAAPLWTYWRNRFVKTLVTFDADGKKVAAVQ